MFQSVCNARWNRVNSPRFSRLGFMWAFIALGLLKVNAQVPPVTEPAPKIEFGDWRRVGSSPAAVEYEESFPSALPSEFPANDTVPLQIFVPNSQAGPVPVVLVLHYWGATDLKMERALCLQLARRGIAGAIMSLPYHLRRTPPGFRSGALAIQPDPDRLIRTMTQSVLDVRRSVDFLQTRSEFDKDKIGVAGTSLGSIVAALAYGVEQRFKTGVFLLSGVDLAHIIWNSSRVVAERESLRREGFNEELLRTQLRPIEPSEYLALRAPSPSFVVGAKFDTVIPRESTLGLINALPGCVTLWLDTGHYGGVFVQKRLLREAAEFLNKAFGGQPYVAPQHVSAPTIRLGAELGSGSGFNIEVGMDLAQQKGPRSPFSSLMLAPRGPRLFIGQGIDRGIAVGAFIKTGQPAFGLLWSTVL